MIMRYTTPYHSFILPFLAEEIQVAELIYSQNGENLINKNSEDLGSGITIDNIEDLIKNASMGNEGYIKELEKRANDLESSSVLRVHLTQDDTSSFTFYPAMRKNIALAEIRIKDIKNNVFVSAPIRIRVLGGTQEGTI